VRVWGTLKVTRPEKSADHARQRVLQKCLPDSLSGMHALRQRALLGASEALLHGGRLTLIDIARAWPGATRVRAPFEACDRLLCNSRLYAERSVIERDMAHWPQREIGTTCPASA